MSFIATRSGLTRVRVFDLTRRIKRIADLFIQRHNKAVDENFYLRTVDFNMRFGQDYTVLTVPYNAYIRLIAKLKERITAWKPGSNCGINSNSTSDSDSDDDTSDSSTFPSTQSVSPVSSSISTNSELLGTPASLLSDEPTATDQDTNTASDSTTTIGNIDELKTEQMPHPEVDLNQMSSYEMLDLLSNSSIHISATQTVVIGSDSSTRTPVAVSGLLYDYATFAKLFLNTTSLDIQVTSTYDNVDLQPNEVKVELCPGNQCPISCGMRNDTIDCLLVDNNGYIVVAEELVHIGRHLKDYDYRLLRSLVENKLFNQVNITDYQAICSRADDIKYMNAAAMQAQLSSSSSWFSLPSFSCQLVTSMLSNWISSATYLLSTLYSLLVFQVASSDLSDYLGIQAQMQRSVVDAQSTIINQSLMAMLPNKTYLRPCEKTMTYYETRPVNLTKLSSDSPNFYKTNCNCDGWYVYEAIPKTNLVMLIVNTTSSCRRCTNNDAAPIIIDALNPNKTAEDQVCASLERDMPLYRHKPDTCFTSHPEESQIKLCGSANNLISIDKTILLLTMTVSFLSKYMDVFKVNNVQTIC